MTTISGFTIVRNAIQYDFPIVACILSALPLVDEFIVLIGDSDDETETLVSNIKSDKIKIIRADWNTSKYNKGGSVYAHQTDVALNACTGDWCLYLQADEVLHEQDIPLIRKACEHYKEDNRVEGFLFNYIHFYGWYNRYIDALHFAYPKEIRMVRNNKDIHSWKDAQSFRYIPDFDYEDYYQKKGTRKLNCIDLNAFIYHYGWCRDPRKMVKKIAEQHSMHSGNKHEAVEEYFDYGNLGPMPIFKGTHPEVMKDRIEAADWNGLLRYTGANPEVLRKKKFGLKYRIINFIENKILGGKLIAGFKNYNMVGRFGFKPNDLVK
jgi:glycosyltransferase involved in cell wall biosynthesis